MIWSGSFNREKDTEFRYTFFQNRKKIIYDLKRDRILDNFQSYLIA